MLNFCNSFTSRPLFSAKGACLFTLLMLGICFFPTSAVAGPYQVSAPVEILTETLAMNFESETQVAWRVALSADAENGQQLGFYMDNAEIPLCRVFFNDKTINLEWKNGTRNPQTMVHPEFLISPGVPAPCDILPVDKMMASRETALYEVRRTAGDQTFVDRVSIEATAVSPEEAVDNAWVMDSKSLPESLVMITAVNSRTGELLVRQLWVSGETWWRYDETPVRKSWRVR